MAFIVKVLKHITLFFLGGIMAIVGMYFFWMVAVTFMLITGTLRKGEMFHDGMTTPEWGDAIVAMLVCLAIMGVCLWLRHLIKKTMPPASQAAPH